jgi:lipopolysaccharide biosynthesis glycosyltransferase
MKDRTVYLATGADDRYVKPLAAMLKSTGMSLAPGWKLDVSVMDGGVSKGNQSRIESSLDAGRISVAWIPMDDVSALRGVPVFGHVTLATYYRVVLPAVLPSECRKVIYLDADTIVLRDLSTFWEMDMRGRSLLAVQEGTFTVSTDGGIPEYVALGIPPDTPLFNGGVFVADLEKWRRNDVSGKILSYLKRNHDHITYWDQDGLNAVLCLDAVLIPKMWNYRVDCSDQNVSDLPADEVISTIRHDAAIIHYASATKPWHYYADHPAKVLFFEFLDKTAWAGWRPRVPLKVLRNPHFWGQHIRRLPIVGWIWKRVRTG